MFLAFAEKFTFARVCGFYRDLQLVKVLRINELYAYPQMSLQYDLPRSQENNEKGRRKKVTVGGNLQVF